MLLHFIKIQSYHDVNCFKIAQNLCDEIIVGQCHGDCLPRFGCCVEMLGTAEVAYPRSLTPDTPEWLDRQRF